MRLSNEQRAADAVHTDAIVVARDTCQQCHRLEFIALLQLGKGKRAVLATAPAQNDRLARRLAGCAHHESARADFVGSDSVIAEFSVQGALANVEDLRGFPPIPARLAQCRFDRRSLDLPSSYPVRASVSSGTAADSAARSRSRCCARFRKR